MISIELPKKGIYLMEDGGSPTMGIFIFIVLIVVDFIVSGFLVAMQNLSDAAVERMVKEEDRKAKLLMRYVNRTARYTHVCQLLVLAVHMLFGIAQIPFWKHLFWSGVLAESQNAFLSVIADLVIFVLLLLFVLIVGIYTPEKVASRKPEVWARFLVRPVHAVECLFLPIIFAADAVSNLLARIFGVDPLAETDDVTEEEIISMVKEGHEQGILLAAEAEMIHNIFEFCDKDAKDIMKNRKNIVALDGSKTFRQALESIMGSNYSRFPVYLENIDNIIGVIHIKEVLDLCLDESLYEKPIRDIDGMIRGVDFIPETRSIDALFAEMQAKKSHMVIVVDEYGQTSGIVAMEDILEEIVGNIEDEHDEEELIIEKQWDGSFLMSGMAPYEEVLEALGIEEKEEFETLNGFLISLIDKIPNDDEVFSTTAYGYLFEILSVANKSIQRVRVKKLPDDGEGDAEGAREEMADDACHNIK